MFIDSRKIEKGKNIESDVCIIGGGIAGISIAKEFAKSAFKVCLLEAGGLKMERKVQSLYQGENVGIRYDVGMSSRRYFGGTSSAWQGYCRPPKKEVFENRPWIPKSGWPVKLDELTGYFERAQKLCELGPFIYDSKYWEKKFNDPVFTRFSFENKRIVSEMYQFSTPPTNFGKAYKKDLEQAANIDTYLYANVADIETSGNGQVVKRVRIATIEGSEFWVSGKIFILATGGIENARVLLLSNKNGQNTGIGNENGLVGRYFMEHPHISYSAKVVTQRNDGFFNTFKGYYQRYKNSGWNCKFKLILSIPYEIQEKEKLLNYTAAISEPGEAGGVQKAVGDVITDLDAGSGRVSSGGEIVVLDVKTRAEQSPNPDSRVSLSEERDVLGLNKVKLDWRLTSLDVNSIEKSIGMIGKEFGVNDIGRVQMFHLDIRKKVGGGCHHMGTTRMSSNPKDGVVDKNCLVHGVSNLYIAGSSVFPTSGAANPTLTVVAMSLRLADHVKNIMG